jgi:hypothetical protein
VRDLGRKRLHRLLQRLHPGLNLGEMRLEHLPPFADAGVPWLRSPAKACMPWMGMPVSRRRNRKASQSMSALA